MNLNENQRQDSALVFMMNIEVISDLDIFGNTTETRMN